MNNQELINKFENSLYEELYHLDDDKIIIFDKNNNRLCIKLKLEYFNIDVFEYLKNNHNKYIPIVFDYWLENDYLIVVEEYVQGKTLEELIENNEINDNQKRKILFDLLEAVAFLHNRKPPIIHRDIKMSNIIITDDGNTKLIDYDAAKTYKENENKDTVLIGTHGSAAPEQYGFGQSDVRTDIYAIGILLKQLFPNDNRMNNISLKASKLNKEGRYQKIDELRDAIFNQDKPQRNTFGLKNIFAFLFYILTLFVAKEANFTNNNGIPYTGIALTINRICFACAFISSSEILINATGIFSFLPHYHDENRVVKYIYRFSFAMLIFIIFVFISSINFK